MPSPHLTNDQITMLHALVQTGKDLRMTPIIIIKRRGMNKETLEQELLQDLALTIASWRLGMDEATTLRFTYSAGEFEGKQHLRIQIFSTDEELGMRLRQHNKPKSATA